MQKARKTDFLSGFKKGAGIGVGLAAAMAAAGLAAAAYSTLGATVGEPLTKAKWDEMIGYTVPPGAVMAFNLSSCPANWSPADGSGGRPDLRGQFIRGLNTFDAGATTRSDGKQDVDCASRTGGCAVGSSQDQALPALDAAVYNNGSNVVLFKQRTTASWTPTRFTNVSSDGVPAVSSTLGTEVIVGSGENRPKNVAMIYCIKN